MKRIDDFLSGAMLALCAVAGVAIAVLVILTSK